MATIDWEALDQGKYSDENILAAKLPAASQLDVEAQKSISLDAVDLVNYARKNTRKKGLMESFLEEFGLSNKEGLALMCLAEALLRVPDEATADKLIAEKISNGDWKSHSRQSDSLLVNASTWGLMLTGKVLSTPKELNRNLNKIMGGLVRRAGEPIVRAAMMQAMKIMGEQFVLGRTIEEAISKADKTGEICSFDMLGEGARTHEDAQKYFQRYLAAIVKVGTLSKNGPYKSHGVSVKISALHPRYEPTKSGQLSSELYPKLKELAVCAAKMNIGLCLDAEEADRLVLSLQLFDRLARESELKNWDGLGLAVQAYQKRAPIVISKLQKLSEQTGQKFMVRLVKGAYWDSEIKHSQVGGMPDFPVWTRKSTTDLAYLATARALLASKGLFPQFATHNAWSLAAIRHMAEEMGEAYECQRLHGMGEPLYAAANNQFNEFPLCRIYAPVGSHEDLLPYLVRRLLENGANTSFVHSFLDDNVPAKQVAASPFEIAGATPSRHSAISLPPQIFSGRKNSQGYDMTIKTTRDQMVAATNTLNPINSGPIVSGKPNTKNGTDCFSPANTNVKLGSFVNSTDEEINIAFEAADKAQKEWNKYGGQGRAKTLRAMADALEAKTEYFCGLMAKEAGKTFDDGIAEVREAVDFLRYYGDEAEKLFGPKEGTRLTGPVGETNHHIIKGRGVFVCISPWNFPLAIFTGQLAAALAAGNTVLAKPAEQTPLTAFEAVRVFQKAGLPKDVLHLLIGNGQVGAALVEHKLTAGVVFTGSTEVARIINGSLAIKPGPIVPLIAETGGLNAMFVDTTALREQVIDDVVQSAFNAAGQRCSALRILYLPEATADEIVEGIAGAMDTLVLGDPAIPSTDIGPVIDGAAREALTKHLDGLVEMGARVVKQIPVPTDGYFFSPTIVELDDLALIEQESFGPILHIIRYTPKTLETLCAELEAKGYGLTLGIHSRLNSFFETVIDLVPAGNIYVNRNMIGAVVGVQPFGGEGLSGTGPKAGGPLYLPRFVSEQSISVNITAQGGDPELLNLSDSK